MRRFPVGGLRLLWLVAGLVLCALVIPARLAYAQGGICALCEARPNLCNARELAACRGDKADEREKPCDQALNDRYMSEYQRKSKTGLELFQHRGELNLAAMREVLQFLDIEAHQSGWDVASERARDEARDAASDRIQEEGWKAAKWNLEQTQAYAQLERSRLAAKLAEYAPNASGAVAKGVKIGGLIWLVESAYRAVDIAGRYQNYQKESQQAAKEGERLLKMALADLEAGLKQAPACLEAARKAAADEKLLDQAKAQIEAWEGNGYLYLDPITNDKLLYDGAVQRALNRLKGAPPQRSSGFPAVAFAFFSPAYAAHTPSEEEVLVTKSQLEDAIKDLDLAIRVFKGLRSRVVSYLRVESGVHVKLGEIARKLAGK